MKKLLSGVCITLLFSGCLGYHVGPATPAALRDVHSISVPMFHNATLVPRIEALTTDTVIKQLQQDGTFRIAAGASGDGTLKGTVSRITRTPARSVRENVLATTEFNLNIVIRWSLVGPNGQQLSNGDAWGSTSFFVSSDVTTDERQALPLAAVDAAKRLVSQLSEGW